MRDYQDFAREVARIAGQPMPSLDRQWLASLMVREGALSPWTRDGQRWVRRWVQLPDELCDDLANAKIGDIAYIVTEEDEGWHFEHDLNCDGPCRAAEAAMTWADRTGYSAVLLAP